MRVDSPGGELMGEVFFHHVDDHLAVAEKPGGLLAVPGRGPDKQDCLEQRVRQALNLSLPQPAVHRLDMQTSGLIVFARDQQTQRHLFQQFAQRQVYKEYHALVEGIPAAAEGEVRLAFRLDPDNRPYQQYDPVQGKLGVSKWRRLASKDGRSLILFIPLTGRTHQLRLHAAHPLGLNCPIIGDSLYGSGNYGEAMLLHASRLIFIHPKSGQQLEFTSPIPFSLSAREL